MIKLEDLGDIVGMRACVSKHNIWLKLKPFSWQLQIRVIFEVQNKVSSPMDFYPWPK